MPTRDEVARWGNVSAENEIVTTNYQLWYNTHLQI